MTTKPESPDSGASAGTLFDYLQWLKSIQPAPSDPINAEFIAKIDRWIAEVSAISASAGDQAVTIPQLVRDAGMRLSQVNEPSERTRALQDFFDAVVAYTRAQDSGQGEAVAWIVESEKAGFCCLERSESAADKAIADLVREWSDAYGQFRKRPLFDHPPKPAQDAAGKGVEYPQISDEQRLWNWSGGRASAWIPVKTLAMLEAGEMQTAVIRWGDVSTFDEPATSLHPAKPAQVGQKYREPTLEDAEKLSRLVYPDSHGLMYPPQFLTALQSIGAVVPAQEGGV